MIRFLPIISIYNLRRFNWNVWDNSRTFRFGGGGILTWGSFDIHAQIEVHPCGEFHFIISELNKKPRISELASLGNLDSGSREKISICP